LAKIVLVTPPRQRSFSDITSYPLGLMYIAAYLIKHGKHDVSIIDLKVENKSDVALMAETKDVDFIGISGMTYEKEEVGLLVSFFRNIYPEKIIIVGGPHATSDPEYFLSNKLIDYVVSGEAELTFNQLISELLNKNKYPEISGVSYSKDNEIIINKAKIPDANLDDLPFPAWDLIDINKYSNLGIYKHKRYMIVFSTRGCPYQCIYCHSIFGKKYRKRSPENVLKEIKILYDQYNIREIHFIDDSFNLDIQRANKILDLIIENKLDLSLSFPFGLRADRLSVELLKKMKEAGTFLVAFAVETASVKMQKVIKKNLDINKVMLMIEESNKLGFFIHGFFMLGFPEETKKEMIDTVKLALRSKLHSASFCFVTPNPGNELYKRVENYINKDEQRSYLIAKDYGYLKVDVKELEKIVDWAYRLFYFNPVRIFRFLKAVPHKKQIMGLIMHGLYRTFLKAKSINNIKFLKK
jgi:anaerobic magnesium-protoporphyrin IX monomethyl ester cyclase